MSRPDRGKTNACVIKSKFQTVKFYFSVHLLPIFVKIFHNRYKNSHIRRIMLVSFSVQNYRSYSELQTISMVASVGAKRKKEFSFPSENTFAPYILRSACLLGPNGVGKSNLVSAFNFFWDFVISSAKDKQEGEKIDVASFKFDKKWRGHSSEFEAIFIHRGALYQYGFAVDADRVVSEWLFSKPNESGTKFRRLFQREYDSKTETYAWYLSRKNLKGEKELWKRSTRDNALFLSTAIQLKSKTLKNVFDWIQKHLRVIGSPDRLLPTFTIRQIVKEGWKNEVLNFMQAVDIKIKSLEIEETDISTSSTDFFENLPKKIRNELSKNLQGVQSVKIRSFHEGTDGELVGLNFREESDGIKVIFSLSAPWLDVLENGYTLVVDELHNSLHPLALKFMVGLFHDPKFNTGNAQLIFTSHETSVMAKRFMHQDQVWFLELGKAENSLLFPLSDYKVRDVSAFQKAYLDGRYGAVPNLSGIEDG